MFARHRQVHARPGNRARGVDRGELRFFRGSLRQLVRKLGRVRVELGLALGTAKGHRTSVMNRHHRGIHWTTQDGAELVLGSTCGRGNHCIRLKAAVDQQVRPHLSQLTAALCGERRAPQVEALQPGQGCESLRCLISRCGSIEVQDLQLFQGSQVGQPLGTDIGA